MSDLLKRPEGGIEDAQIIVKGMMEMYRRAAKNGIDEKAKNLAAKRADASSPRLAPRRIRSLRRHVSRRPE